MNLNQSNQEKLVMLIASGKKTYTEIKANMPELNDGELRMIASLPIKDPDCIVKFEGTGGVYTRTFQPDDSFYLTEQGQNILHQVQIRQEAINLSLTNNRLVKWTLFLTGVSVLLTLYQIFCR